MLSPKLTYPYRNIIHLGDALKPKSLHTLVNNRALMVLSTCPCAPFTISEFGSGSYHYHRTNFNFRSFSNWRNDKYGENNRSNKDPWQERERPKKKRFRGNFIDSLRIHVKAGHGGQGLPAHGGAGGRGGDVIAVGGDNQMVLQDVCKASPSQRFTGNSGGDSRFFCLFGERGKPTHIQVPLGVTLLSEDGKVMGEINKKGESVLVAKGGLGGCAANGFSGQTGQAHSLTVDLKLIADVGFLGFPNAGKSTLLKAISAANPRIASYPFTTVTPNLGIVEFGDGRRISFADLPGLIEGAHMNQGMGHKFLKHVERTRLLLFIVDLHGFQLGPKYPKRSALETIVLLNKELELYQPELTEKPAVLALNKIDLPNSYEIIQKIRGVLEDSDSYAEYLDTLPENFRPAYPMKFDQIFPISAATDTISVTKLKNDVRKHLDINDEHTGLVEYKASSNVYRR